MTTRDLLRILSERGVRVVLGADGPRLKGPPGAVTKTLLRVVKIHREALIDHLTHERGK